MSRFLVSYWWDWLLVERTRFSEEAIFIANRLTGPLHEAYTLICVGGHVICRLRDAAEFYGASVEEALAKARIYRLLEPQVSERSKGVFFSLKATWTLALLFEDQATMKNAYDLLQVFTNS